MFWFFQKFFKKKILFIYFQREGKGGRKRGRETSMCGCLSHAPHWGSGWQPGHVPWLGIEPATLRFTGWHSIHWAIPARAKKLILKPSGSISENYFMFGLFRWKRKGTHLIKEIWLTSRCQRVQWLRTWTSKLIEMLLVTYVISDRLHKTHELHFPHLWISLTGLVWGAYTINNI